MAEADLSQVERPLNDNSNTATAIASGELNGLMVYFDLRLSATIRLSTHPCEVDEHCSWHNLVWNLEPMQVRKGERIQVNYQYRATKASHRVTVSRV